jgi:hypothetical protein
VVDGSYAIKYYKTEEHSKPQGSFSLCGYQVSLWPPIRTAPSQVDTSEQGTSLIVLRAKNEQDFAKRVYWLRVLVEGVDCPSGSGVLIIPC